MDQETFFSQFCFNQSLAGARGVECEYFLTDDSGMPVPRSAEFLERIDDPAWTYELSACQVEFRTVPEHSVTKIVTSIENARYRATTVAQAMGIQLKAYEVSSDKMPLDVYPHDARYQELAKILPHETLKAACRVAGIHIHWGADSLQDAIDTHNAVVEHLKYFMMKGDHSDGERLRLYRVMASNWKPPRYESPDHLYAVAKEQGFLTNPRDCWHLVRISRHGTVELRMFGMTDDTSEIASWIDALDQVVAHR